MNAEILYEERFSTDMLHEDPDDQVYVQLTRWVDDNNHHISHYLLKRRVWVDREVVVDVSSVFEIWEQQAKMIRNAIHQFDELVANHPTFGQKVGPE